MSSVRGVEPLVSNMFSLSLEGVGDGGGALAVTDPGNSLSGFLAALVGGQVWCGIAAWFPVGGATELCGGTCVWSVVCVYVCMSVAGGGGCGEFTRWVVGLAMIMLRQRVAPAVLCRMLVQSSVVCRLVLWYAGDWHRGRVVPR